MTKKSELNDMELLFQLARIGVLLKENEIKHCGRYKCPFRKNKDKGGV